MKTRIVVIILSIFTFFSAAQEAQNKNTTICWDVSASMVNRDLEKDLSVLHKVFERNGNQEVQVLLFGIDVVEKKYSIKDGDWTQLKQELESISYDGGTIYKGLLGKVKNPNVYVFTDGQKTLSKDVLSLEGKSFLINSSPSRDAKFLERTALVNKSRLMDFATMLPENVRKLQEKAAVRESEQKSQIEGTVYIDNKPAPNVRVGVKGISDSFLTNGSGDFSIPAEVGDTLIVTSRNSKTIKTVPIEIMSHTKVFMVSNIVALDEVIVIEEKQQKADMALTGYGLQKQEAIGYVVSEIKNEDITEITTDVGEAINTKIPGLNVPGKIELGSQVGGGIGAAQIRGIGTINMNTNALVVVNGVPMRRSENQRSAAFRSQSESVLGSGGGTNAKLDFIDPANIEKITVLKGLAATNAWGSEGRGGVILITTKTATFKNTNNGKPVDQALLKNNVYDEAQGELQLPKSPILSSLEESKSNEDAYDTYLSLKSFNQNNSKFFLDAFDYFKGRNKELAEKIISNLLERNSNDIEVLRTVSKAFSNIGAYENVVRVNEEIIEKEPTDVNAYLNRAKAKTELGKSQEALKELIALEKGDTYFSVNASGISKTLKREIKNLITNNKSKLNLSNIDEDYLKNVKYKVRLVFEWNVPGAEFELQFVNPQKRFFNWSHTNENLRTRIEDELKNNYRIEEYEFYGDVAGEWVINAKYLGDTIKADKVPLVLKTTIYKDFGSPNQTKEEILAHFSQPDEKKNLKRLIVY